MADPLQAVQLGASIMDRGIALAQQAADVHSAIAARGFQQQLAAANLGLAFARDTREQTEHQQRMQVLATQLEADRLKLSTLRGLAPEEQKVMRIELENRYKSAQDAETVRANYSRWLDAFSQDIEAGRESKNFVPDWRNTLAVEREVPALARDPHVQRQKQQAITEFRYMQQYLIGDDNLRLQQYEQLRLKADQLRAAGDADMADYYDDLATQMGTMMRYGRMGGGGTTAKARDWETYNAEVDKIKRDPTLSNEERVKQLDALYRVFVTARGAIDPETTAKLRAAEIRFNADLETYTYEPDKIAEIERAYNERVRNILADAQKRQSAAFTPSPLGGPVTEAQSQELLAEAKALIADYTGTTNAWKIPLVKAHYGKLTGRTYPE